MKITPHPTYVLCVMCPKKVITKHPYIATSIANIYIVLIVCSKPFKHKTNVPIVWEKSKTFT